MLTMNPPIPVSELKFLYLKELHFNKANSKYHGHSKYKASGEVTASSILQSIQFKLIVGCVLRPIDSEVM